MVVSAHALTRRYGRRIGIEDVDFDVREGSLFGFLGPNGSGKTTTIRILMGFLRANSGRASIFGFDCWRESHRIKTEVGYLPGDVRLYPWMTGREALRIFGAVRGQDIVSAGEDLAAWLGLDLGIKVRKMSRGMRQKLGLVLAMAHHPRLLLLDEPTMSLDPLVQEEVRRQLLVSARAGQSVFFSSHSLSEVEKLCDRVVILREGRVVANETLDELRRRAQRTVEILWKGDSVPDPPPFLGLELREGRKWTARLDGSIPEFLRWAASLPVENLVVGPPDLDSLFRGYYAAEESGSSRKANS